MRRLSSSFFPHWARSIRPYIRPELRDVEWAVWSRTWWNWCERRGMADVQRHSATPRGAEGASRATHSAPLPARVRARRMRTCKEWRARGQRCDRPVPPGNNFAAYYNKAEPPRRLAARGRASSVADMPRPPRRAVRDQERVSPWHHAATATTRARPPTIHRPNHARRILLAIA